MSSKAAKAAERSHAANVTDVEKYFAQIRNTIRQYEYVWLFPDIINHRC